MAALTFQQEDTVSDSGVGAGCSGASAGTSDADHQMLDGGTPGSTEDIVDPGSGAAYAYIFQTDVTLPEPDKATWEGGAGALGDYVVPLDVTTGRAGTQWTETHICERTSGGSFNTVASLTGQTTPMNSGTQSHTVNRSSDFIPADANSTLYIVCVLDGPAHGGSSIGITPSLIVTTPIQGTVTTHTATAAQSFPVPSQGATGAEILTAAAAQTMPVPSQAATGAETLAAAVAQTIPVPSQAATGILQPDAVAAQTVPVPSQAATGSVTENPAAAVAQTVPVPSQSATGTETLAAVAAQTVPTPSQVATAYLHPDAVVAQTVPTPSQAASGIHGDVHSAVAAQQVPVPSQAASGLETITGAVAQTVPTPSQAASGAETLTGIAAQQVPVPSQAVTGAEEFACIAAQIVAGKLAVVDSYVEGNRDGDAAINVTAPGAAQSLTGDDTWLRRATFYLSTAASPSGNLTAKLYAHTGVFGTSSEPTGAALATSAALPASALTGTPTLYDFYFAAPALMQDGVNYCIAIETDTTGGAAVQVGRDTSTPSHAGNSALKSGGSWTPFSSADFVFYVASGEALWQQATGAHGVEHSAIAAQTVPVPSQAASGAIVLTGVAAQQVPTPTQSAAGTVVGGAVVTLADIIALEGAGGRVVLTGAGGRNVLTGDV